MKLTCFRFIYCRLQLRLPVFSEQQQPRRLAAWRSAAMDASLPVVLIRRWEIYSEALFSARVSDEEKIHAIRTIFRKKERSDICRQFHQTNSSANSDNEVGFWTLFLEFRCNGRLVADFPDSMVIHFAAPFSSSWRSLPRFTSNSKYFSAEACFSQIHFKFTLKCFFWSLFSAPLWISASLQKKISWTVFAVSLSVSLRKSFSGSFSEHHWQFRFNCFFKLCFLSFIFTSHKHAYSGHVHVFGASAFSNLI